MRHIAFYISTHGYGHASRCIPIIEELLEQADDLVITVKTSGVLAHYMSTNLNIYRSRIHYMPLMTDVGLVFKQGTMDVDTEALLTDVKRFIRSWKTLIEQERIWISQSNTKLIVADIVPWVLKSAAAAGVGSILISNFTWAEIYKELLPEDISDAYLECYQKADALFLYPFSGDIEKYYKETKEVGLVSRRFNEENVRKIRMNYDKPIVYVSVGKSVILQRELVVDGLPYQFLSTEGIRLKGKNTAILPVNTINTHDYIKAADCVVTKSGWSTVAESVCARKPMIILKRDEITEDRITAQKLNELGIAFPIQIYKLNTGDIGHYLSNVDLLKENYKSLTPRYNNCADNIAERILAYLPKGD